MAIRTLREFWQRHPASQQSLRAWLEEVQQASWKQPADVKAVHASASILRNRRVVFNIKGNAYRLVVALAYNTGVVFIKFVGTH